MGATLDAPWPPPSARPERAALRSERPVDAPWPGPHATKLPQSAPRFEPGDDDVKRLAPRLSGVFVVGRADELTGGVGEQGFVGGGGVEGGRYGRLEAKGHYDWLPLLELTSCCGRARADSSVRRSGSLPATPVRAFIWTVHLTKYFQSPHSMAKVLQLFVLPVSGSHRSAGRDQTFWSACSLLWLSLVGSGYLVGGLLRPSYQLVEDQ